jgi:hypothetical protein
MEEPFDHSLESFFNQLINPFSEQENHMLAQMYLYNNGSTGNNNNPTTLPTTNSGINKADNVAMLDADKVKGSTGKPSQKGAAKDPADHLKQLKEEGGSPGSPVDDDNSLTKQKNRRVNQNIASRNYRNRKKEYVGSLEGKVTQLAIENEQLKKEIASLKRVDNFDSMRPDPALLTMVVELKHIIASIDDAIRRNADDNAISYLLQLFHLIVEKRHHVFEKEVEKLVNPFAQAKLAMLGYAPVLDNPSVSSISGPNADGWWSQYITEAKVTREQRHKLKQMREELWKIDHDLRQERTLLDKSIKEFYLHKMRVIPNYPVFRPDQALPSIRDQSTAPTTASTLPDAAALSSQPDNNNVDVSDIIELSRKLNALKKNFCTQRNLMLNAFARLSQLLSPRQQAMLLVRIHIHTRFDGSNMELLKNVWQSVTNSESPSVLSLLSMIPANQPQPPGFHQVNKLPSMAGTLPCTDVPMMQPPAVLAPHTITSLSTSNDPSLPTAIPTTISSPPQQHTFRGPL